MSSAERRTDLRSIASSLYERDRAILHALVEHKVLSTQQLRVLFFRSLRRCQHQLKELKDLGLIKCFEPRQAFARGRSPEHHFVTGLGVSFLAYLEGIPRGQIAWVPDEGYEENRNLRHRMGVNAFFCGLVEASLHEEGHGLHRWRPERKVRTKAGEIQPDGFGRYIHPGGACEFYLEYDRGTEGATALSDKLRGYMAFAAGWGEGVAFPNVLVVVPRSQREADVDLALARADRGRKTPIPIFITNEELLVVQGMLGPVWLSPGSKGERLCLTELPGTDPSPYDLRLCLGLWWTGGDGWSRISPMSSLPRFPPGLPRRRE